jgi:hypothetical protein
MATPAPSLETLSPPPTEIEPDWSELEPLEIERDPEEPDAEGPVVITKFPLEPEDSLELNKRDPLESV